MDQFTITEMQEMQLDKDWLTWKKKSERNG